MYGMKISLIVYFDLKGVPGVKTNQDICIIIELS